MQRPAPSLVACASVVAMHTLLLLLCTPSGSAAPGLREYADAKDPNCQDDNAPVYL